MIVGDYIKIAKPIGSAWLVKRHKMGCCSATVRNDMSILEEAGLINQPHFSSGRVPTASGYRYYIDHLMKTRSISPRFRRRMSLVIKDLGSSRYSEAVKVLASEVANITGGLTIVSLPEGRLMVRGMQNILSHPEFRDELLIKRIGVLYDRLDFVVDDLREKLHEGGFGVYLGKDLDYEFVDDIALVFRKFRDPFGENHLFGTVGPLRMDYSILPELMDFASKTLEDF